MIDPGGFRRLSQVRGSLALLNVISRPKVGDLAPILAGFNMLSPKAPKALRATSFYGLLTFMQETPPTAQLYQSDNLRGYQSGYTGAKSGSEI